MYPNKQKSKTNSRLSLNADGSAPSTNRHAYGNLKKKIGPRPEFKLKNGTLEKRLRSPTLGAQASKPTPVRSHCSQAPACAVYGIIGADCDSKLCSAVTCMWGSGRATASSFKLGFMAASGKNCVIAAARPSKSPILRLRACKFISPWDSCWARRSDKKALMAKAAGEMQ